MASNPRSIFRFSGSYSLVIGIWLAWSVLNAWVLYSLGQPVQQALLDSLVANLQLAGACFIMFTILRFYLPGKSQYFNLIALVLALSFIWYIVYRYSIISLHLDDGQPAFWEQYFPIRITVSFLIISCFTLITVLNRTQEEKQIQEKRKSDAEKLARDAELFKLQQQLQPHFLFNSLNSISALIGTAPEQARTMIQQLSDFLRGTLKINQDAMVPLSDELQQLDLYLGIEMIRFGHRLQTEIQMENACAEALIPPLLLQPVMENAIKFGLYDTTGNVHIRLHAACAEKILTITVSNPYDKESSFTSKGTGFGLASVQRRLFLIFGRNDLLQTSGEETRFLTTIKIPQP